MDTCEVSCRRRHVVNVTGAALITRVLNPCDPRRQLLERRKNYLGRTALNTTPGSEMVSDAEFNDGNDVKGPTPLRTTRAPRPAGSSGDAPVGTSTLRSATAKAWRAAIWSTTEYAQSQNGDSENNSTSTFPRPHPTPPRALQHRDAVASLALRKMPPRTRRAAARKRWDYQWSTSDRLIY
jgi:hypothetical protein